MRLLNLYFDFLKIFSLIKRKHSKKNYAQKVKDWSFTKIQLIEKKFILKQINFFKKKRILDYGCNDCSFNKILKKGYSYWGVDSNSDLLDNKIKKYSRKFKIIRNYKIPFKKNSFDCILLSHVIGHIENTNLLLQNFNKILSTNGIIIIVTPNKYFRFFYSFLNIFNNYEPDQTIVKYYSLGEIISTVEKNKFEVIKYYKFSVKGNKIKSRYLNSRILVIAKKVRV